MSAAIRFGYTYRPDDAASRSLPALSLNCVIRFSQPSRATQLKIQASRACAWTWLWMNRMQRAGSSPQAISAAAISRVWRASSFGSCQTVMACRSTTQKMVSCVSCIGTQLRMAPR
jgi:hypothetical protein